MVTIAASLVGAWVSPPIDFLANGASASASHLTASPGDPRPGHLRLLDAREGTYLYGVVIEAVDPDIHAYRIDHEATAGWRARLAGRELVLGHGPGEVHPDGQRTGELLAGSG